VADGHSQPELFKKMLSSKFLKIVFKLFPMKDGILEGHLPEHHFIRCKSAGLIGQDTVNNTQFFNNGCIEDSALFFDCWIVQFPIEGEKDAREGLDPLYDYVEGDGY